MVERSSLILIATLIACGAGCGDRPFITVGVNDQPAWVVEAAVNAASFWDRHGEEFVIEDVGEITVVVEDFGPGQEGYLGFYNAGQIRLTPLLEDFEDADLVEKCVLAHELFHAIGGRHVEKSVSLMNETLVLDGDDCAWSGLDQEMLCETTGNECE